MRRLRLAPPTGCHGGLHFIATEGTVLDGTTAVPMDVVEVMASAAQDFDARVASLDAELDAALALARDATAPPADAEFSPNESQGLWPTWCPESSTLALTFVHQRLENWGEMTGVIEIPGLPPPYPEIWEYHYYGAEYVVRTVIDASGTTLEVTEHGPAGFGHKPAGMPPAASPPPAWWTPERGLRAFCTAARPRDPGCHARDRSAAERTGSPPPTPSESRGYQGRPHASRAAPALPGQWQAEQGWSQKW